jgi:gluconolactonase
MEDDISVVASGLEFPEGPVWLPDGSLLVVEIRGQRLTRIRPGGERQTVAQIAGGPNGAAIGPDGLCWICNNGGFRWHSGSSGPIRPVGAAEDYKGGSIQRVDLASGAVETIYTHCDGVPLHGPNDIVFDGDGGFWFTDMGKVFDDRMMRGALFYARCDGSLIRRAAFGLLTPNGVGLAPDGRTVYVSETETSRLWSFAIEGRGTLKQEPWPSPNGGRLVHGSPGYQRFDSMAVEAGGLVCVATLVRGGISVISPEGELVEFHPVPDVYCTNICFGGPDLRTAYITLSGTGELIAMPWPRPGLALIA